MSETMTYLIEELFELGLTRNQARVYVTLVRFGNLTSSFIARYGELMLAPTPQLLDDLVSRGIIKRSKVAPFVYGATEPRECINTLMEARHSKIVEVLEKLKGKKD